MVCGILRMTCCARLNAVHMTILVVIIRKPYRGMLSGNPGEEMQGPKGGDELRHVLACRSQWTTL